MSRTITTIDQSASLALPPEAVEALGVEAGAELDDENNISFTPRL